MINGPFAIDVQTMLIVMLMSCVLMATVLWFAFAGRFRDGLAKWTTSLWAQGLAWLLFAGYGLLPNVLSVAAANGLLALTWSFQLAAIQEFGRRPVTHWLLWAPAAAIFALFLTLTDDRQWQLTASSLLYGAANLLITVAVLRERPPHILRARWLLAGCYAIAATTLILTAWLTPGAVEAAPTANSYHGFLYLGTYALIVAGSRASALYSNVV